MMKKRAGWIGGSLQSWGLAVLVYVLLVDGGSAGAAGDGVKMRHLKFERGVDVVGRAFRLSEIGASLRWPAEAEEGVAKEGPGKVGRVLAGTEVGESGFFPEVVAIAFYDNKTKEVEPFCAGSLVDEKVVLTSGYCARDASVVRGAPGIIQSLFVCAGTTNLGNPGDATCVLATDGYIHKDSYDSRWDGIAVLGLAASLVVEVTRPGRVSFEKPQAGTLVYAVGFGMNRSDQVIDGIMRYGDALLVPSDVCVAAAAQYLAGSADIFCMDGNYDGSGRGICRGDVGSPMVVRDRNNPENNYIIGVASTLMLLQSSFSSEYWFCPTGFEGIYTSLYSDSHREFIQAAVENLGGSLDVVGEDATVLSCEGRQQLCEGLPGNRTCLLGEDDVPEDECCRNSGREISCLKAVSSDCADNESLAEVVKADEEKYDAQCLPKHGCGKDDVDRCLIRVEMFFEERHSSDDYDWVLPLYLCEEVAKVYACIGRLLERCDGNEIVLEAKTWLDTKSAEESCDKQLCNVQHMTECSRELDRGNCRTIILQDSEDSTYYHGSENPSSCCWSITLTTNCLMGIKYACGGEEPEAIEEKLKELDWLRENGNCYAREACDADVCTSFFSLNCEDSAGLGGSHYYSSFDYYYGRGQTDEEFVRFCCELAQYSTLCLEKSLEECGENSREELENEIARISQLLPEDSCRVFECAINQCVDFESLTQEGSIVCHIEDFARICLQDLASKCEENREAIQQGLEQLENLSQQENCRNVTCDLLVEECDYGYRECGSFDEVNGENCCISAAVTRKCLVNFLPDCPNKGELESAIQNIDEDFPEDLCLEHICDEQSCSKHWSIPPCSAGISELESLSDQSACCESADQVKACVQDKLRKYCAKKPEELENMIDQLDELYPMDQCSAVECKGVDCEPSEICAQNLLFSDDEIGSFECCRSALQSQSCFRDRKGKCEYDSDAIAYLDAQLVKWDEVIDGKCDDMGCQDRVCLSSMASGPCARPQSNNYDSFYEEYWENAGIDDKNKTIAFQQTECCESANDARRCLQSQLKLCSEEMRENIEEQIAELEAEHPEQQCQDLFCSGDHCSLYLESNTNCNASPLNFECCKTAARSKICLARSNYRCTRDDAPVENSLAELQTRYPEEVCGCITSQQECLTALGSSCLEFTANENNNSTDQSTAHTSSEPTLEQCCARTGMVQRCLESLRSTCPDSVSGGIAQKLDKVKTFEDAQCCETNMSSCLSGLDALESSCPADNTSDRCCSSWWDAFQCLQSSQMACGGASSAEVDEKTQHAREILANCVAPDETGGTGGSGGTGGTGGTGLGTCFPGRATVELENGSVKSMMELEAGDRVLVGDGLYSDVIGFTHRLEKEVSEFVTLHMASGEELSLSPSHYAIVSVRAARKLVAAREVLAGSMVMDGHGNEMQVVRVSRSRLSGLYNPHTLNGKIVVNGVMVSTYTETVHPRLAHGLLIIVRVLYRLGIKEPLGSMFYGTVFSPFVNRVAVRISALAR